MSYPERNNLSRSSQPIQIARPIATKSANGATFATDRPPLSTDTRSIHNPRNTQPLLSADMAQRAPQSPLIRPHARDISESTKTSSIRLLHRTRHEAHRKPWQGRRRRMLLQTSSICSIFNASPTPHVTNVVNLRAKTPEKADLGLGLTTFVTRSAKPP